MIRQLFIKIVFVVLLYHTIAAQNIGSISIAGNKKISDSEYLTWLSIKPGGNKFEGIIDTAANRLSNNLRSNGYYNFKLEITKDYSPDSTKFDLKIYVEENNPVIIQYIFLEIKDSSLVEIIEPNFKFIEGNIFTKHSLERAVSETLANLQNVGYPFASIKISSVYFYSDSSSNQFVDITAKIELNQISRFDKIDIEGNSKTKDYVIIRAARINTGEYYNQKKIDNIPKLLNRLRYFNSVSAPNYFFNSSNEGVLNIVVEEKETNSFDGIVGYVPSQKKGTNGYFTGYINISLQNIFGTGRSAGFRWQKENRNSQELEIKYLEPWFLDFPVNLSGIIFQRVQDTTYVERKFGGSVEFLATDEISASLLLETQSVIPTDPENRGFTVFNSTLTTSGVIFKLDSRDDVYSPTEGFYFLSTYKFSSKKINGPALYLPLAANKSEELQRIELDFLAYYQPIIRQVLHFGFHAKELKSDLFEISDLYKLGGTNTLRGYLENQFFGNRIFWSNLEYRYLLTKRSFAFLFFDSGYYLRNDSDSFVRAESFKLGYGMGISLETALGVMAVSFAFADAGSFSDGKIHFGLLNEF